jgi:hypothetical protein
VAVLRLALEIDSDVYPELYAKLASLGRMTAREEKLRQLAALGLVWELARLHGPAVWDTAASPPPSETHQALQPPGEATEPAVHDDIDLDLGFDAPITAPGELPVLLDVVAAPEVPSVDSGPAPLDEAPPPRVKASRSARLARMKDRGLFQNG